jgi:hypothetical protein
VRQWLSFHSRAADYCQTLNPGGSVWGVWGSPQPELSDSLRRETTAQYHSMGELGMRRLLSSAHGVQRRRLGSGGGSPPHASEAEARPYTTEAEAAWGDEASGDSGQRTGAGAPNNPTSRTRDLTLAEPATAPQWEPATAPQWVLTK